MQSTQELVDYGNRYVCHYHSHLQKFADATGRLAGCGEPLVQLLTRQAHMLSTARPDYDLAKRRLDDILSASYNKFYAYLYQELPPCWRSLYTEAAILKFWVLVIEWARSQRPDMVRKKEWEREERELESQREAEYIREREESIRQGGEWPPQGYEGQLEMLERRNGRRFKQRQLEDRIEQKRRERQWQYEQEDKQRKDEQGPEQLQQKQQREEQLLDEMIKTLDLALILAGGGGAQLFINDIIALLEKAVSPPTKNNPDLANSKPENEGSEQEHPQAAPEASSAQPPSKRTKLSLPPPAKPLPANSSTDTPIPFTNFDKPDIPQPPPTKPSRQAIQHNIPSRLSSSTPQYAPPLPPPHPNPPQPPNWSTHPSFSPYEPFTPPVTSPIQRIPSPSLESFQSHLSTPRPLILTGLVSHWPALTTSPWSKPAYLLSRTFSGRRLVPVEIGRSYVDAGWSQKIIPFSEFLSEYITSPSSDVSKGYLAQHQLFSQLPQLRNDIVVPDLCYTSPPPKVDDEHPVAELEEPMLNAWLGPPGTITPLHTDPYHNLLVQVVGRKYVRLYPPQSKVKTRGKEGGVSMDNTAAFDVGVLEGWDDQPPSEEEEEEGKNGEKEEFGRLECVDCILEPGETLYIPEGWWHYVRGLSVSFSVSFWWN
ncbi:hypothetical protein QBC36DRAFT_17342 [Triangularia setosa]|uniref:JmjC domain-containing protein n=1 Tax=Triangularia setosa TaxID=2587417 RepID=A0AAN6W5M7_9PEZI|nr:hypothetical protein QBC36DRAFT_17342 [Podospora setosa]